MMKRATMASFSPKPTKRYNDRSISMPTRSHPTTLRIEEELNKLKAWEATTASSSSSNSSKADSICKGLSCLEYLYKCIEELLQLPLTQKALALHQNEKWVEELLDGSVKYLDVCGNTRDAILTVKESVRELESALRRRMVGDSSLEDNVNAYVSLRKKMKKEVEKCLAAMKQMNQKYEVFPMDLDNHLAAVVRVLREASLITSSIFQSLLLFLSTPVLKPRPSRWSLVSILVQRGVLACENYQHKSMNELENVDIAISNLFVNNASEDVEAEKIESAQRKLEILDGSIEGLENGLEGLFRLLIHTRVEHLTRDQNSLAAYELISLFCQLVVDRLLIIKKQRECPADLKEGIASLIFAVPRCCEIPELMTVRNFFERKYGRDFVSAASDLRPDCGVNYMIIKNLSVRTPSGEVKLKLLTEIAKEYRVEWGEEELLEPPEELIEGPITFVSGSTLPVQSVQYSKLEKTSSGERECMHYEEATSAAEAAAIFANEAMSAACAAAYMANQASSQAPHRVDTLCSMLETRVDENEGFSGEEETLVSDDDIFVRFQALKLRR